MSIRCGSCALSGPCGEQNVALRMDDSDSDGVVWERAPPITNIWPGSLSFSLVPGIASGGAPLDSFGSLTRRAVKQAAKLKGHVTGGQATA